MTRNVPPSVQDIWPAPFAVTDLPESGVHRDLVADEATCARIAAANGLRTVSRLVATFDLKPLSGDRVHVTGEVSATVGQTCVVTLEPLDSPVQEAVDIIYAQDTVEPEPAPESDDPARHGSWDVDPPEPIVNGAIDLGALAVEFLVLGINPYPRKEGAALALPTDKEGAESHPFAALASLKGKKAD